MRTLPRLIPFLFAATLLSATAFADPGFNIVWRDNPMGPTAAQEQASREQLRAINAQRDQLHRITLNIIHQYELTHDLPAARADAAAAQTAYDQAMMAVRAQARRAPENAALSIEIEKLESQLSAAQSSAGELSQNSTPEIDQLAATLLAKRSALSARINQSVSQDNQLLQLQYRVIDANAKVYNLQADLPNAIHSDASWRAARAQLDQASKQLTK